MEFIRAKVSEVDRQSHAITSGSISGSKVISGKIDTKIQTESNFKLENDNHTFLLKGKELIEVGDELAFEYKNNNDGFFEVLMCKNLTKNWIRYSWSFGMICVIIFKSILWGIFLFYVFLLIKNSVQVKIDFISFIGIFLWMGGSVYTTYSALKQKEKKFIKKYNL